MSGKTTCGDTIITCSQCGQVYYLQNGHNCKNDVNLGRWTTGGNGSHWHGCEEAHWDCKIAKLEAENKRLREALVKIANWKIACHEEDGTTSYVIGGETSIIARAALEGKE